MTAAGAVIWRASRTPDGIATLALRETSARHRPRPRPGGPARHWALAQLPALCGARDDLAGFDAARHPLIADAHRRNPGLRLSRTDLVFDALASAIFEQKVTGHAGVRRVAAHRDVVRRARPRADARGRCSPRRPSRAGGAIPSWAWHRAGLEPPQARTVVESARRGESIVRAVTAADDGDQRERMLTSLRGVGPWTSAETRIRAFGDPDAVSVGDYHLAHEVGFALDRRSRVDDDGMLELLAPWTGHRQRVIRLIGASGAPRAPARTAAAPRGSPRPLSSPGAAPTLLRMSEARRHWTRHAARTRHPSSIADPLECDMPSLNPYLSFKDQAREAMEFYQGVFGGELIVSTFARLSRHDQTTRPRRPRDARAAHDARRLRAHGLGHARRA